MLLRFDRVGEKLVTFLTEPKRGKWPKKLPKLPDRTDALAVCKTLLDVGYIHRSDKVGKGMLQPLRSKEFEENGYYTWNYEGDKTYSHMMTGLMIAAFLFCTCFPIWPNFLKVWLWYLSVTILIFTFTLCIVRLLLFIGLWVCGYEFWLLPNLFDENLGVAESFVPLYSFAKSAAGQSMTRGAVLLLIVASVYWAVSQPTEFDGFITAQRSFIDDLYSGNLLSDMSQQARDNIDKPKVKSLDDLLQELEEEDEEEAADAILEHLMDEDEAKESGSVKEEM